MTYHPPIAILILHHHRVHCSGGRRVGHPELGEHQPQGQEAVRQDRQVAAVRTIQVPAR